MARLAGTYDGFSVDSIIQGLGVILYRGSMTEASPKYIRAAIKALEQSKEVQAGEGVDNAE